MCWLRVVHARRGSNGQQVVQGKCWVAITAASRSAKSLHKIPAALKEMSEHPLLSRRRWGLRGDGVKKKIFV